MSVETVGCKCGNAEHDKVWDEQLRAYYHTYECEKCNYYWEGPIYDGTSPHNDLDESRPHISFKRSKVKEDEIENER